VFDLVPPADASPDEFQRGDVRDRTSVDRAVRGAELVIHAVAVQPVSRSSRRVFLDVNVGGTENVLAASREASVRRVIHLSSSAVYGVHQRSPLDEQSAFAPVCDYGRSKALSERIVAAERRRGLDVIILRPRVLLGAGRLGVYHLLFDWIADGKPVYTIGRADEPFQPLSVRDLARACRLALTSPRGNQDYVLGASRFSSFRDDLASLLAHAGSTRSIVPLPATLARAALGALDLLDLSPLTAWHYLGAGRPFFFDCSRAQAELGWSPEITTTEMLRESYDWYVAHRATADRRSGATQTHTVVPRALALLKALS
jgi:nucleoside-diphosphate-sugar epimerase